MGTPLQQSDAELISAVRAGDVDAYGELFARHVESARRLGRQLVAGPDVDDLVSEAFAKVLGVLQRGGGPDLAFRAYLLTAVRRLHVDRIRATARVHITDDVTPFDPGVPFRDTALEGFESATAARAFASLPERWQLVLWHTEVEEQKPAEVAQLLGMSPNSVSALAYRAREGLRRAYLSMHARSADDDACAQTRAQLGGYVRGGLSRREASRVEEHLDECRPCTAIYLELVEVNSDLRGLLAPLLLGGAAAAYLAEQGGLVAASGGVLVALGRFRDAVVSHAPAAAVSGAAAAAVVAGVSVTLQQDRPAGPSAQDAPVIEVAPSAAPSSGPVVVRTAARTDDETPTARPSAPGSSSTPSSAPSPARSTPSGPAAPTGGPSTTSGPTSAPSSPGSPSAPATPSQPASPTQPADQPADDEPALIRVSASASAGADGVEVEVDAGLAGIDLPPIRVALPSLGE